MIAVVPPVAGAPPRDLHGSSLRTRKAPPSAGRSARCLPTAPNGRRFAPSVRPRDSPGSSFLTIRASSTSYGTPTSKTTARISGSRSARSGRAPKGPTHLPRVSVGRDEEREHDSVVRQMPDELGESKHDQRHRKQREPGRHHGPRDLT